MFDLIGKGHAAMHEGPAKKPDLDLDALERLAAQATPGPWEIRHGDGWYNKHSYEIEASDESHVAETLYAYNGEADAAYIVAACNSLPGLIKMYRDAKDEAGDANAAYQVMERDNVDLTRHILEARARVVELERQRDKAISYILSNEGASMIDCRMCFFVSSCECRPNQCSPNSEMCERAVRKAIEEAGE